MTTAMRSKVAAPMIAAVLVRVGMNGFRAMRVLRPDMSINEHRVYGYKIRKAPRVRAEIKKLMNSPEHNIEKFLQLKWEVLEQLHNAVKNGEKVSKELLALGLSSDRVLTRIYAEDDGRSKGGSPMKIPGMDEKNLSALTGLPEGEKAN